MSVPQVQRASSEAALRLLKATYHDYRASRSTAIVRGRVTRTASSLGSYDVVSTRRQACYLRLVSIVEAYADLLYRELFTEARIPANATVQLLLDELDKRSRGWGDRNSNFHVFHKFKLTGGPEWPRYESATHVRNTIAHGLGRLTARQRRNPDLSPKLAAIDVGVNDGKLVLTERSLRTALALCEEFVRTVDDRSQAQ